MTYTYITGATRWKKFKPQTPGQDVRLYRAPKGWSAFAHQLDWHPVTNKPLKQLEWWLKETYEGDDQ